MVRRKLTFREGQLGAVEVLRKLDRLCTEQGWRYCLAYGSLLGAIRHKGIIPWDDDIDIFMPRPDYEKLRVYFQENAQVLAPIKMFDKKVVPDYPHSIVRISDQRYHLEFDNEKDYGIGLFVDIYPLDGAGDDFDGAAKLIRKTKPLASLCFLTGRKCFARDNTASNVKMLVKIPAYLWANLWGNKHYIDKLSKLAKTYDYETSKYVANVIWPGGRINGVETDIFPRAYFEDLVDAPFEDMMAKIPKAYHEILTIGYGDYMTPPPPEGRKTNHTYDIFEV